MPRLPTHLTADTALQSGTADGVCTTIFKAAAIMLPLWHTYSNNNQKYYIFFDNLLTKCFLDVIIIMTEMLKPNFDFGCAD